MTSFWGRYARFLGKYRYVVLAVGLLLAVGAARLASKLELKTDFGELLPKHAEAVVDLERIQERLGGVSTLVVAIEGGDWKKRQAFAEECVSALRTKLPPGHVHFIDYKITEARDFLEKKKLLYVDLPDLKEVLRRIQLKVEDTKKRKLVVDLLDEERPYEFKLDDIRAKYESRVKDYDHFPDGYFITPDRTLQALLLRIPSHALGESSTDAVIEEVRSVVEGLEPARQGYKIIIGGDPVTAQDERQGIVEDLVIVSSSSIVLCVLAIVLYYRSKRSLLLIAVPVAIGTALAFGVAKLTIGSLNSNTAFLGSIIVGNGVNFGIMLLARYLEERRRGGDRIEALAITLEHTWSGTATAALAASFAYGSLMVTDFRGFSQFGFIGGIGMLLCWLSAFTVLPALIVALEDRWPYKASELATQRAQSRAARIDAFFAAHARKVALAGVTLTVASVLGAAWYYRDPFEYNFRNLRSRRAELTGSSALGKRVDRIFEGTKMMAGSPSLILIDRPDQLDPLLDALMEKKQRGEWVDRTESIRNVLPRDQVEKVAVLDEIRRLLDDKVIPWLSPEEAKKVTDYRPPDGLRPITADELPELLLRPFLEPSGKKGLIVYVYPPPNTDFMDGKLLIKFADAIRAVQLPNGEVLKTSGHEVVLADIVREIQSDGPIATAASFLGVLVLVSLAFRRLGDRAVIVVTLLIGVLWMCGLAALLRIKVNMLNFVALPITFGIGVEYATNVYRRYILDGRTSMGGAVWKTGTAVALCSLTTIIGYGSLLFADTRALNSFGLLAVVGEITTVVAALLWMPALLHRNRQRSEAAAGSVGDSPPAAG